MVDMAHNSNHRRAGLPVFFIRRRIVNEEVFFNIGIRDPFDDMAKIFDDELR